MPINVCITVDTEFTIGGAFSEPNKNTPISLPSVYCNINGKSHGLGYILNTLELYSLQATFFLEALNVNYFGDAPLAKVAEDILNRGQDIQLHLHPCWQIFKEKNWMQEILDAPPADTLTGSATSKCIEVIEMGIKTLERIGCPRPVALRMGNLFVDKNIYHAMNTLGLNVSSNIGLGISKPDDADLHFYGGRKKIAGVLEVPVTTYNDLKLGSYHHNKCFTIIGCSFSEMKNILLKAYQRHVNTIVILTHPSEFVKTYDLGYKKIKPNNLTQIRFKKLCEFLSFNQDKFRTVSFKELANNGDHEEDDFCLKVPSRMIPIRLLEEKLGNLS